MSSDEAAAPKGWKKRRLQGACDTCRRKKIKCKTYLDRSQVGEVKCTLGDSANMPGNRCSNCIAFNLDCTHTEPVKKRGPKSNYVEQLEQKVKNMEEILRKFDINPNDLTSQDQQQPVASTSSSASPPNFGSISSLSSSPNHPAISSSESPPTHSQDQVDDEDDLAHVSLAESLSKLSLEIVENRFFGASSGFMLMSKAHMIKNEITGHDGLNFRHFQRPQYWSIQPWEQAATQHPTYTYPDNDLMVSLISLYFTKVNIFLPVLHAPTFKRSVAQGLHLRDPSFGANLLLVCAVGSRFSNDPRVFADPNSELSCGWKWFDQVQIIRKSLFDPPSLHELQFYSLSIIYLLGSSSPQASWTLVGVGLRFAIELGVHRRKPEGFKWTVEDELKKRAFWVLVSLDRLICSFVGRPSAIRDEDYDLEMPFECDDEYWDNSDPDLMFTQPPDKPSVVACFTCQLQLCEILAFAMRTLYMTKKSKMLTGLIGDQYEQKTVSEIDSALNNWIDSVPEHLRWDPDRENLVFFQQSAFLYSMYFNVQIQTHRPFLQKSSPLSFPSLAICTNAARSCIHVLDRHARRGVIALPHVLYASFISGVVLLINIWGSLRAGIRIDHEKEMLNIQKIMRVIRACDQRWIIAGRFWDMLAELARDFIPPEHLVPSNKRAHDSDVIQGAIQQPQAPPTSLHTPSTTFDIHSSPTAPDKVSTAVNVPPVTGSVQGWTPYPASNPERTTANYSTVPAELRKLNSQACGLPVNNSFEGVLDLTFTNQSVCSFLQGYTPTDTQLPLGMEAEAMGANSVNMWSSAPTGFSYDDWSRYIESMSSFLMTSTNPQA